MIELGLARVTRLLKNTPLPWRAIHVAGTNGKGSVCAYTSAMLHAGNISCGRFTSPHLIDRWDCVTVNEKTVDKKLFLQVENVVKFRNQIEDIKASEFELLTATAFEIFNREEVEVGVVEVGLGGRDDATNVLKDPLVTVITKIGQDHQSFLGNTLEDIASHKAGIIKNGAHCLVDGSNHQDVIGVFERHAEKVQAGSILLVTQDIGAETDGQVWQILPKEKFVEHQQMNICLAFEAIKRVVASARPGLPPASLLPAVRNTLWPGRLQELDTKILTGRVETILLDGAHNLQSARVLGSYVYSKMRRNNDPVTWVVAMSRGRAVQELLSCLLRPGDHLFAVGFGPVEGMPWVNPAETGEIGSAARSLGFLDLAQGIQGGLAETLTQATKISNGGPLVVTGSLYLVSDLLRLLRDAEQASV